MGHPDHKEVKDLQDLLVCQDLQERKEVEAYLDQKEDKENLVLLEVQVSPVELVFLD